MKKLKKGFTIVELVIVIAVIAVLAAVLIPTFVHLSKKAKVASDQSLVTNLNTALKMEEAESGKKPETMHGALLGLQHQGYIVENLVTRSDEELVYSLEENKFYLSNNVTQGYNYWHIYFNPSQVPSTQTWSIYAGGGDWTSFINLTVGFDAGNVGTSQLNYVNKTGVSKTVIIRTNSASTTLTIDAANDTVKHYDTVGSLNIIAVDNASYHENGTVAFAEIAKGRIVLESGSEIKHIHINANEDANGFEEVIIRDNGAEALPEAITRDQVDVSEAKAVVTVESGSTSETVYVYPYTDAQEAKTGTTEQTATQNTSIASALGQLVLDNGSDAGEKAMSNNEKTEAKTELVNEAKASEVAKEFEEDETAVAYNLNTGVKYETLIDAFTSIDTTEKTTIVLLKNVVEKYTGIAINIAKDKNIVFDLNGFEIIGIATNSGTSAFISNSGTLTIKDSKADKTTGIGTGKINITATNPDPNGVPGYASNGIRNYGHLMINSGIIENNTEDPVNYAAFAIDNEACNANSNNALDTDVTLIINGGKFRTASSSTIRMYLNTKGNYNNVIKIKNADVGSLWLQDNKGATAAKGELSIDNSSFLYSVSLGYYCVAENVKVEIQNTTFNASFYDELPDVSTNTIVFKNCFVKNNFESLRTGFLTDGTFGKKIYECGNHGTIYLAECAAEGYAVRDNGNGTYSIVEASWKTETQVLNEGTYGTYNLLEDANNAKSSLETNCEGYTGAIVEYSYVVRWKNNPNDDAESWKISGRYQTLEEANAAKEAFVGAYGEKYGANVYQQTSYVVTYSGYKTEVHYFDAEAEADAFVATYGGTKTSLN